MYWIAQRLGYKCINNSAYDALIEDSKKLIDKYKVQDGLSNFTVLEAYDFSSDFFLSNLHEIAKNKAFLFHIHVLRTDCLNAIVNGDEKEAVARQGMLKGIDKVMQSLFNASKVYKEMLGHKENEQVQV